MSNKILVLHHLGLGDHFVMNGFVHLLLEKEKPQELLLVVKQHNLKTVEKMYDGYPEVKFYSIKDLDDLYPKEDPNSKIVNLLSKGYGYLGFGVHGPNRQYLELDKSWAACFYKQYGVDPSLRWSKFKYTKDMSNYMQLAKKVISEVGPDYIILHDDPSRGFNLNAAYVIEKLIEDKCDKMPIIYLGKDRYKYNLIEGCVNPILDIQTETLYDYCHLLANARACHMMDSSVALLLDFLPEVNIHQKRYMHEYAKVGEILSTEGLFQKEWDCIKEVGL
jgi:hypothetical protein